MADMAGASRLFATGLSGRRVNRRRFVQGAAAGGLSLAGAAALGQFGPLGGVAAQDKTVLKFYHDKAPWQDYFKQMGDLAEKAIGINWEPTSFPDTTSYQSAVLPALPTSDAPDFFTWWSGFRIEDLYKQGVLADVSDLWSKATGAGELPESLAAGFTFDGKQYAIPSNVSYWVVFYNKKVFAENGVEAPTTWADLMATADKLKTAGVIPFGATQTDRWPSFIWFEEMVLRTNPKFYEDLTAGKAKYTDPPCVQAMETWKGLIDKEYFTSFDVSLSDDLPGMFAQGQLAMMPIGSWYQSNFLSADLKPGEDYDLFIMPNIEPSNTDKVLIVETGALAVASKSTQADAAKKMASWWLTPDAQTAWCNKLGDAPADPKAKSDNPVVTNLLTKLTTDKYRLVQRYWEASPVPIVEGAVDFLSEFMLNPGDYKAVLQKIQDLADKEWAKRTA